MDVFNPLYHDFRIMFGRKPIIDSLTIDDEFLYTFHTNTMYGMSKKVVSCFINGVKYDKVLSDVYNLFVDYRFKHSNLECWNILMKIYQYDIPNKYYINNIVKSCVLELYPDRVCTYTVHWKQKEKCWNVEILISSGTGRVSIINPLIDTSVDRFKLSCRILLNILNVYSQDNIVNCIISKDLKISLK